MNSQSGHSTQRPIILIVGPTAGGKTSLSVDLAIRLPGGGECISADSMQVYRGMDIGTAKPTHEERRGVPHHLLDVADPSTDGFTVAEWRDRADEAVADIRSRGLWPIVVGGTNLYVRALLEGVFEGPAADPAIRAELEGLEPGKLRSMLEELDPESADRIHPNDRRRTIRALEVHQLSGETLSSQQRQWSEVIQGRSDVRLVGLDWPVAEVNRRMNARVKDMVKAGFLDEVRGLIANQGLGRQAREAVGYREMADHIQEGADFDQAVEQVRIRTRRLGKQQRTWLRRLKLVPNSLWLQPEGLSLDALSEKVIDWLSSAENSKIV